METIYLILVIVLFVTAISDLIVGVSNDAVNFLNSAIGAKAASFRTIMIIAALGIVFGATFSSGMMEVVRTGIFHPEHFYFSEIIFIFLAVMITDVILLDGFNTFGMPTSTTVSIVFELLGAAVGVSLIKLSMSDQIITLENGVEKVAGMSDYINSNSALVIIAGILLSVVVAFSVGAIIQFLSRVLFSFNYKTRFKYFGALWGGLAITAITYFILIKGLKGSAYANYQMSDGLILKEWVKAHGLWIILVSFIAWSIIMQILTFIPKFNILKVVVLVGTFALAMAFAGNDLVNFIGVPLAGYDSFMTLVESGQPADTLLMTSLAGKVKTPFYFLIAAGLIMVVTLWTSKKAKSVVKTSLDLGRQEEGYERFESTALSRLIVRKSSNAARFVNSLIPESVLKSIDAQFDHRAVVAKYETNGKEDAPAFDMIRASVTLVVASILISFATSLKLPLSTTYVTFMVAMGTSLADRAWGTESAVYRITGVISVIGGWFLTALTAFTSAFIMALLFSYFGIVAVFIMVAITAYMIYRTHFVHRKRVALENEIAEETTDEPLSNSKVVNKASKNIIKTLNKIGTALDDTILAFGKEDLKQLKLTYYNFEITKAQTKSLKDNINKTISKLEENAIESGHYYVQAVEYLREISHSADFIIQPALKHIDNSHKAFSQVQIDELHEIQNMMNEISANIITCIKNQDFSSIDMILEEQQKTILLIKSIRKKQVKRIKTGETSTRNSLLFLSVVEEFKNIFLYLGNLLKSHRDFINYVDGNEEETEDHIS